MSLKWNKWENKSDNFPQRILDSVVTWENKNIHRFISTKGSEPLSIVGMFKETLSLSHFQVSLYQSQFPQSLKAFWILLTLSRFHYYTFPYCWVEIQKWRGHTLVEIQLDLIRIENQNWLKNKNVFSLYNNFPVRDVTSQWSWYQYFYFCINVVRLVM